MRWAGNCFGYGMTGNGSGWAGLNGTQKQIGYWHHLVVQIDGNKYWVYVDGVLDASNLAGSTYVPDPADGFTLGADPYSGSSITGKVSDVQYYNYVLTSNDVAYLYNHPGTTIMPRRDSYIAPVAWWKLNEASGPGLADSAHGLYPLTLNGDSPTATVGTEDVPVGMPAGSKSIQFKGSTISRGEYATRAYTAALNGTNFSVSLWVKPEGDTAAEAQEYFLGQRNGGECKGWQVRWAGNCFGYGMTGNGSGWAGLNGTQKQIGYWHHLVVQIDGNKYWVYVDGVLDASNLAGSTYVPDPADGFTLGADPYSGSSITGKVSDVQYYNYILTSNDVVYLYANPGTAIMPPKGTTISIR